MDLDPESVPELADAGGIVILPDAFNARDNASARSFLTSAFALVRKNGRHLMAAAREKGGFLATVSFCGGGFGFNNTPFETNPIYGGLAGLAKTADLEWKEVLCHALDMPGNIDQCKANAEAAAALMMTHGTVEMGLTGSQCRIPTLEASPCPQERPALDMNDVVVITGGAKGVTAECAVAVARETGAKVVLVGRSPAPFGEPAWLHGLEEATEIKRQILAREFKDQKVRPADLEKRYQAICSNRAIQTTLERLRSHTAHAAYHSADIRDQEAIAAMFEQIRSTVGPITAVIHGAGVLEDKLIIEKRQDQFDKVFGTKVLGLEALMAATRKDRLKYFVLFSSIAARTGNTGQCDYAMANEVLNKVAQAHNTPECRFISINWGPWAGGMVNDSLKKEFSKRGIDLIPLDQGAEQLIREMGNPSSEGVEIVIGADLTSPSPGKKPVLRQTMAQPFGIRATPIINAHKIAHEPVVPFAMMADLMACAAARNNPGLVVAGLDDMRLLKGITPGDRDVETRVLTGKCRPKESEFTADSALTSMDDRGREICHTRATLILKEQLPDPPVLSKAAFMDLETPSLSAAKAYETVLFHTKGLDCIVDINGSQLKESRWSPARIPT